MLSSVRLALAALVLAALTAAGVATFLVTPGQANVRADHTGWPVINGGLFINKFGGDRPMDMRAGQDPFHGRDLSYRCDADHRNQQCFVDALACPPHPRKTRMCDGVPVMPAGVLRHHELLGAGGDDSIWAADGGDVIWGDYKYPPQPLDQRDHLYGGKGKDFIYASHGVNEIHTGGGPDLVNARYGRGDIYCDSPDAHVNLSKRSARRFTLHSCRIVTYDAIGTHEYDR
jgi:hypothetical protein